MSILELIARRSKIDATAFSLPDLLAGQALARIPRSEDGRIDDLIVEHLSAALVRGDQRDVERYIDSLTAHDVSLDRLLFVYFARTACCLGDWWADDRISFSEVTDGMGNLMQVTRDLTGAPTILPASANPPPCILLVRTPGDDHFYGLQLAAYQLRKAGWMARIEYSSDATQIHRAATKNPGTIVGYSIASAVAEPRLRTAIRELRALGFTGGIVVGGALSNGDPDLSARVGADFSATPENLGTNVGFGHFQTEAI